MSQLTDFVFLIMKRIANEIQIDCLMRKLAEVDSCSKITQIDNSMNFGESEVSLVNQLQEQALYNFCFPLSHLYQDYSYYTHTSFVLCIAIICFRLRF